MSLFRRRVDDICVLQGCVFLLFCFCALAAAAATLEGPSSADALFSWDQSAVGLFPRVSASADVRGTAVANRGQGKAAGGGGSDYRLAARPTRTRVAHCGTT